MVVGEAGNDVLVLIGALSRKQEEWPSWGQRCDLLRSKIIRDRQIPYANFAVRMCGEEHSPVGQEGTNLTRFSPDVPDFGAVGLLPDMDSRALGAGEEKIFSERDREDVTFAAVEGGDAMVEKGLRGRCTDGG